jgi:hypothetical protein
MGEKIMRLMESDFSENDIQERKKVLEESFTNAINVQKLINLIR